MSEKETRLLREKRVQVIVLAVLVSLFVRVFVSLNINPTVRPDSHSYISLASSLSLGHGYAYLVQVPHGSRCCFAAVLLRSDLSYAAKKMEISFGQSKLKTCSHGAIE